uniref:Uncharacterized protein n=1 Tax=Anopheles atroparvus TaxID=41427 RepID=A0AAG5DL96_ANOAO
MELFTPEVLSFRTICAAVVWQLNPVPLENAETDKIALHLIFFVGIAYLFFAIVYWIGCMKRVRCCITLCLVHEAFNVLTVAFSLFVVYNHSSVGGSILFLITYGTTMYIAIVLTQQRKLMLNDTMPSIEDVQIQIP